MSKRKSTEYLPARKQSKRSSKELSAYFKSYKNGINDFHLSIFRETRKIVKPKRVLYPGCYRHVTTSLIFENVVYVDCDSKLKNCFQDKEVLDWINENKEYENESTMKFVCKTFASDFGEENESFELVISACAGIVTSSCSKYVRKGGYFLVSDAHYDARMLILDDTFELKYVWEDDKFTEDIDCHFITTDGVPMTREMVEESIKKPKARRSFKLKKEAMFYLFRKK